MDLYFERHDGQAVTIEDFVKCFEDASGRDLDAVFALVSPGRHAARHRFGAYDAAAKTFTLSLEQMVPADARARRAKEPMHIPLRLGAFRSRTAQRRRRPP